MILRLFLQCAVSVCLTAAFCDLVCLSLPEYYGSRCVFRHLQGAAQGWSLLARRQSTTSQRSPWGQRVLHPGLASALRAQEQAWAGVGDWDTITTVTPR